MIEEETQFFFNHNYLLVMSVLFQSCAFQLKLCQCFLQIGEGVKGRSIPQIVVKMSKAVWAACVSYPELLVKCHAPYIPQLHTITVTESGN